MYIKSHVTYFPKRNFPSSCNLISNLMLVLNKKKNIAKLPRKNSLITCCSFYCKTLRIMHIKKLLTFSKYYARKKYIKDIQLFLIRNLLRLFRIDKIIELNFEFHDMQLRWFSSFMHTPCYICLVA